jgi:lambda family phage minor tail protein L
MYADRGQAVRTLDGDITSRKNAETNKPIFLYKIHEYNGSADLFLAEYDQNVTFDGQVYSAFPITHEFIEANSTGQISQIKLKVANVNRFIQAYIEAYDFRGKQVDIIMVFADKLDDAAAKVMETLYIDSYSCNEKTVEFSLTSKIDVIDLPIPSGKYLRTHCRWVFKGTECAYAGAEGECNRTFQRCKELANQERFGGFPSIPFRNIYVVG